MTTASPTPPDGARTPADGGTAPAPEAPAPTPAPPKSPWIFHQGEFIRAGDLYMGPGLQGLHYGTGVFEGIRSYAVPDPGTPSAPRSGGPETSGPDDDRDARAAAGTYLFQAAEHYARLHRSCRLMRLDLPHSVSELVDITAELLRRNELNGHAYIRPVVHKLALRPGTPFGVRLSGVSTALTIMAMPMGAYVSRDGISCGVSSWRRIPDSSLPVNAKVTGGYANNALAVDEASAAGYDDAIMLNQRGEVAEASTANIFVVRDGQVATPHLGADILPGLTRAAVIDLLASEGGPRTAERTVLRSELHMADEVFLTGTGCQVVPVVTIDGRPVGDGVPGPVTRLVQELHHRATSGQLPAYRHLNHPVVFRSDRAGTGTRP
ncbi:aminotransferase class IV [Streptomyces tubercidicus]|uniref:Branched-chain amino acid aminotransferase n=1 Tax=Streptomyces tubercidicus TaxID=47759 RepID=A0A640UJ88_9ACTN|nr:aminotransferase class IV [Streptomyces tubercidicus]WAU10597.1 aminotransferase class IV [Streptomyces tubercidicus]GFE35719.1 branched-chain amino acid aminotransferase [Streptomyces tubercidicus]